MYVVFYDYPDPYVLTFTDRLEAENEYNERKEDEGSPPVYLCEIVKTTGEVKTNV